eukprot:scaffold3.g6724.t1
MAHTILLLQTEPRKESRTFVDREKVEEATAALIAIFEKKLRELNPGLPNITYELSDIWSWIDNMPDLSALVFDGHAYVPHGKSWIKERVHTHLIKQAKGGR